MASPRARPHRARARARHARKEIVGACARPRVFVAWRTPERTALCFRYLDPLVEFAAGAVPPEAHAATNIFCLATAGESSPIYMPEPARVPNAAR